MRGQDGAITVFLSIILLIMITLAGVIVDLARINVAESQIQRAVETSVYSTLAGYYRPLKEQYGLFVLGENDKEILSENIKNYLSKNLMADKEYLNEKKIGKYVDLYDYRIESIEAQVMFNIAGNSTTSHQILQYMKYRAPKELVQGFLNKIELIKRAGATSEAYKEKINFEKKLKGIDSIQRQIYKNIYGKYEKRQLFGYKQENLDCYVRKLDEKGIGELIDEYTNDIKSYKRLKKELENITEQQKDEKEEIELQVKKAKKQIEKKYDEIIDKIYEYHKVNEAATKKIDELILKSKNIREELNKYKAYLNENKNNIAEDSFLMLMEEIGQYEKQISYAENGDDNHSLSKIKSLLNNNMQCLQSKETKNVTVIDLLKKISPNKAIDSTSDIESIKNDIIDKIMTYDNEVEYNYSIRYRDMDYRELDTRKENQERGNERININDKEKNQKAIIISDKEYSLLPSVSKIKEDNEDNDSMIKHNDNPQRIEFYEEEKAGFSEYGLSFLSHFTNIINPTNFRDKIYINEYIMGTFKNAVTDIDDELNLKNFKKSDLDTYFDTAEVEYILNGKKSEKLNQILMDSKILLTRFGLNSIHVFTCKDKGNTAELIATAVAGLYTGGTGIPIIKSLVLLSWAMEESVYDLDELKAGRDIPIYKTEDCWKTDWKAQIKEEAVSRLHSEDEDKPSSDESDLLQTSYQDYLRFFLLVQDKDVTIERVQNIIQLNLQKTTGNEELKLNSFNTYIRVEVVVSIKYLFLTQRFVPNKFKTEKNRHMFKVVIYQGY